MCDLLMPATFEKCMFVLFFFLSTWHCWLVNAVQFIAVLLNLVFLWFNVMGLWEHEVSVFTESAFCVNS